MSTIRTTIQVARHDGWAIVRIQREHKRNALDRATRAGLLDAFRALEGEARAIVLTGQGESFCAGLDLKERAADTAGGAPDTAGTEWVELIAAMRAHPAAFIAAVNGVALGGGITLMNACDLAIASDQATFSCPELGFATYASASGPTTQLSGVSRKRVAWMLLTMERLPASTLERWGLINEVVAGADLLARAGELAARISLFDAIALAEVKKTLDHVPAASLDWRSAMEYGQRVNETIRRRTREANPQG